METCISGSKGLLGKKPKMGSKKGPGKLRWLKGAEGGSQKESFMVKSSATAYEALESREG